MTVARAEVSVTALRAQCDEAVGFLDRAIDEPPKQLTSDLDRAERTIARLRDGLIDVLRGAPAPGLSRPREALGRVNAVLSLVVGVEYPVKGLHRKQVEQARDALRAVRADELS